MPISRSDQRRGGRHLEPGPRTANNRSALSDGWVEARRWFSSGVAPGLSARSPASASGPAPVPMAPAPLRQLQNPLVELRGIQETLSNRLRGVAYAVIEPWLTTRLGWGALTKPRRSRRPDGRRRISR